MKKLGIIAVALVLAITGVVFAACSKAPAEIPADSEYIGTWKALDISAANQSESADSALEDEWTITFNADGTYESTSGETTKGTWSITDEGVKMTGDTKLTLTKDGDKLATKVVGATITFEKQADAAEEVSE